MVRQLEAMGCSRVCSLPRLLTMQRMKFAENSAGTWSAGSTGSSRVNSWKPRYLRAERGQRTGWTGQ